MNSLLEIKQFETRTRGLAFPSHREVTSGRKREQMLEFCRRESAPWTPSGFVHPPHAENAILTSPDLSWLSGSSVNSARIQPLTGFDTSTGDDPWGREVKSQIDAYAQFALVFATQAQAAAPRPNKLASFIGRVKATEGDVAFVSAVNEDTEVRFEAEIDLPMLKQNGIGPNDEFLCTLTRKGHQTTVDFSPLPAKVLSEQDIRQILAEVDSKLG